MSNRILRFGIIGAGGRGINCFGKYLDNYYGNTEVAALCDPNEIRMDIVAEKNH